MNFRGAQRLTLIVAALNDRANARGVQATRRSVTTGRCLRPASNVTLDVAAPVIG